MNDLAKPFKMSQPAISKHLKVLEKAGLISTGLDRQRRPRRIEAAPLEEANKWIERYKQFWEVRYDHLESLLEEMKTISGKKEKRRARK